MPDPLPPNRRDFLTGRAVRSELGRAGERLAQELDSPDVPSRGPTLLLRTVAMACDFDIMLNPVGPPAQLEAASDALELVHELEQLMSVYREDARLSVINRTAPTGPVDLDPELQSLLRRAQSISEQTQGAFDPTSGALVSLWRRCRQAGDIPTADEIAAALACCGLNHLEIRESTRDAPRSTVRYLRPGVELNLGAIGMADEAAFEPTDATRAWMDGRLVFAIRCCPTNLWSLYCYGMRPWEPAVPRCSGFGTKENGTGISWIRGRVGRLNRWCLSVSLHRMRHWRMLFRPLFLCSGSKMPSSAVIISRWSVSFFSRHRCRVGSWSQSSTMSLPSGCSGRKTDGIGTGRGLRRSRCPIRSFAELLLVGKADECQVISAEFRCSPLFYWSCCACPSAGI
jgi:hypothetical protein